VKCVKPIVSQLNNGHERVQPKRPDQATRQRSDQETGYEDNEVNERAQGICASQRRSEVRSCSIRHGSSHEVRRHVEIEIDSEELGDPDRQSVKGNSEGDVKGKLFDG
jgi:hypothetical protein